MENWLRTIQNRLLQDQTLRLAVIGGTALLFLIVIVDSFGARDRAVAAREAARLSQDDDGSGASVPSVYRVPRDLASEAALAARIPEADAEPEPESSEVDLAEAAEAESAPADAEIAAAATEADVAAPDMAEDEPRETPTDLAETADDAVEDSADPVAQDDAPAEDAPAGVAQTEEDAPAEGAEASADTAAPDDAVALLASADLENGQRVWRQCAACHVYDAEQNRGGPHLVGIIGRDVASAEGWRYSRALQDHGGAWSVESLLAWLENPDSYIPGNQMAFRGLRNEQDRIDVLGLLNEAAQD